MWPLHWPKRRPAHQPRAAFSKMVLREKFEFDRGPCIEGSTRCTTYVVVYAT